VSRIDAEALLVALVLAPGSYSRNRFFAFFEERALRHARKRAKQLRGIVKELTEPWPHAGARAPLPGPDFIEEREEGDGVVLNYHVSQLNYRRSAVLTKLEAATVHYALAQSGHRELEDGDRVQVEKALLALKQDRDS
jgi:hypothetical protein